MLMIKLKICQIYQKLEKPKILTKNKYLAQLKKSALVKAKTLKFIKDNSFEIDFFIAKAKNIFTHLWKTFIRALIFHYFDSEYYIQIEMDTFSFVIGRVLGQLILDQYSPNYKTHESYPDSFKSDQNCQLHLIVLFS